jgi:hypothetical protein
LSSEGFFRLACGEQYRQKKPLKRNASLAGQKNAKAWVP